MCKLLILFIYIETKKKDVVLNAILVISQYQNYMLHDIVL